MTRLQRIGNRAAQATIRYGLSLVPGPARFMAYGWAREYEKAADAAREIDEHGQRFLSGMCGEWAK